MIRMGRITAFREMIFSRQVALSSTGKGRSQVGLEETADADVKDEDQRSGEGPERSRRQTTRRWIPRSGWRRESWARWEGSGSPAPPRRRCTHGDDFVIPPPEHGRQGDDPHGYGGRGADPGHGGKDGADDHRADGQAAPEGPIQRCIMVYRSSATPARSRIMAMKIKSGMARRVNFPMAPVGLGGGHEKTLVSPEEIAAHDPHAAEDKGQGKPQGKKEDERAEKEEGDRAQCSWPSSFPGDGQGEIPDVFDQPLEQDEKSAQGNHHFDADRSAGQRWSVRSLPEERNPRPSPSPFKAAARRNRKRGAR